MEEVVKSFMRWRFDNYISMTSTGETKHPNYISMTSTGETKVLQVPASKFVHTTKYLIKIFNCKQMYGQNKIFFPGTYSQVFNFCYVPDIVHEICLCWNCYMSLSGTDRVRSPQWHVTAPAEANVMNYIRQRDPPEEYQVVCGWLT